MLLPLLCLLACAAVVADDSKRRTTYACESSTSSLEPITSLLLASVCPIYYTKTVDSLNLSPNSCEPTYACITRGDPKSHFGVPLTNLDIALGGETRENNCPKGSIRLSKNLNAFASKESVYFCTERWGEEAITDLTFVTNDTTCPAGYTTIPTYSGVTDESEIYACIQKACKVTLDSPSNLRFRQDGSFKITQFTDSHCK